MFKALFLTLGLLVSSPARAQEEPKVRGPVETVEDGMTEKKSQKEIEQAERLKAYEESQADKEARVVVLQWPETDTDHNNAALQRNIITRIARTNANFYPEIDLYQSGRKEQDRTLRPADQRAVVPSSAIDRVLDAVDEVATIPWDALSGQDWGLKAAELRALADEIWFVDRSELREPLFLLYAQIGRAAENRNDSAPPFFEQVGGRAVNYYWFLAASMAHRTPSLMSKLTEQDMHASIGYYKDLLDRGAFPALTLAFSRGGKFDAKAFLTEYQVFINGNEEQINDEKGLFRANPGRVDVYLSRADGHSLSERVELDKLDDKFYYVLDVARTRMGLDFIDQLMEHPNECLPNLSGDILNYLSIYAKLHPEATIYVAVPELGSVASYRIRLWRWDRKDALLKKVDAEGLFPVRFAGLMGTGLTFSSGSYQNNTISTLSDDAFTDSNPGPTTPLSSAKDSLNQLPKLGLEGIPFQFHLRGHYGHLMVSTGLDYAVNVSGQGEWRDVYQTDTEDDKDGDHILTVEGQTTVEVVSQGTTTTGTTTGTATTGTTGTSGQVDCPESAKDGATCVQVDVPFDVLKTRKLQRLVHLGIGVMVGENAAVGFGPYVFFRTGWYNLPHAADMTLHAGWAAQAPFSTKSNGRVRPLVNVDLFGGGMVPYRDTLTLIPNNNKLGKPLPTFGFALSIGSTF